MTRTATCEACGSAMAAAEGTYDDHGRLLCRRCSAHDQVARANDAIAKGEQQRVCGRCGGHAKIVKATVWRTRSGVPLFDQQRYRCSGCQRRFTTSSGVALAIMSLVLVVPSLSIAAASYPYGVLLVALPFGFVSWRIFSNARNPLLR